MTIEIRQLVIRARAEAHKAPAVRADAPPPPDRPHADPALAPGERDALVAACVREVLRALKKSRER